MVPTTVIRGRRGDIDNDNDADGDDDNDADGDGDYHSDNDAAVDCDVHDDDDDATDHDGHDGNSDDDDGADDDDSDDYDDGNGDNNDVLFCESRLSAWTCKPFNSQQRVGDLQTVAAYRFFSPFFFASQASTTLSQPSKPPPTPAL